MPRYESSSASSPSRRTRSSSSSSYARASKEGSIVKTSLVFLGSIVAATFCAHKYWPKGVTYGEKEEWEIEEVRKVKKNLQDERRAARRDPRYAPPADRERRTRYSDREGGRNYYLEKERSFGSSTTGRDRDRYNERANDRASSRSRDRSGDVVVERRSSQRETYYPPAPQRYSIAAAEGYNSQSGLRSRQPSVERRTRRYYDDQDDDPDYVYAKAATPRSRRSSFDGGRERRRYSRDVDDY